MYAAYFAFPSLIGVSAIALFLMRRSAPSTAVWLVGFALTSTAVALVSWRLYVGLQGLVPASSLVKAFAVLYFLPFVVLTNAAHAFRTRVRSRAVGVALLIILFLATGAVAAYASGHYFELVNASG